jgi:hypothetical protein
MVLDKGYRVYLRAPKTAPGAAPASFAVPAPAYVGKSGTAAEIAARNRIPVDDFCRWNGVTPNMVLDKGERIFLKDTHVSAVISGFGFASPVAPVSATVAGAVPATDPAPAAPVPLPKATLTAIPQSPASSPVPLAGSGPAGAPTMMPATAAYQEPLKPTVSAEPLHPVLPVVEQWKLSPGSLRSQVAEWCAAAGYTLVWQGETDYEMESFASYRGGFEEGVNQLFNGLQRAGFPLRITVYRGNNVLEVAEN